MPSVNLGRVSIVPKGAWSNSNSYEKLDVVTYGGGSYIANKDVPAGTSLTTTEYWSNFVGALSLGTVETVSASTGASAELITTSTGQTLNLSIPRGVAGNESIDDTKGEGDTDYVWSADKSWNEVNDLNIDINGKANAIEKTASGDIVNFDDGADNQYVKSLKVNIEPVQDLHGYDNPWPAGGGKNLIDFTGPQTVTGQTQLASYDTSEKTTFTLSATIVNNSSVQGALNIYLYNGNTYVAYKQVTVPANAPSARYSISMDTSEYTFTQIRVIITGTSAGYSLTVSNAQLEKSATATSYVPYSNICPISGWDTANVTRTGVNLFEPFSGTSYGITYTVQSDGGIKVSGTVTSNSWNYISKVLTLKELGLKVGDVVTLSAHYSNNTGQFVVQWRNSSHTVLYTDSISTTAKTRTLSSDITEARLLVYFEAVSSTVGTVANNVIYPQLELGSSATPYQPYQGQQVIIDLDGTRYRGILDVTRGKMLVTHAMVDLGTLTWKDSQYSDENKKVRYFDSLSPAPKAPTGSTHYSNIIAEYYKTIPQTAFLTDINAILIGTNGYLWCITQADVNPIGNAVYELATPITITLTPQQLSTLLGENHIWANSGDVEVTYPIETKDYIDNIIDDTAGAGATTKIWSADKSAQTNVVAKEANSEIVQIADVLEVPVNLFDATGMEISNSTNWKILYKTKTSLSVQNLTGWSTGSPNVYVSLPAGNYIFSADFTNSSVKSFYISKNGSYYKTLENGTEFTVESGNTYGIYFTIGAAGTYTITDISVKKVATTNAIEQLDTRVNAIEDTLVGVYANVDTTLETQNQVITSSGALAAAGSTGYRTQKYPVTAGKSYKFTASTAWGNLLYAFYDENDSLVQKGDQAAATSTNTVITNKQVIAPTNSTYVLLAYCTVSLQTSICKELSGINMIGSYPVRWAGKKWVCVGDSLTEENIRTTKHYFDYVAESSGISIVNMGVSGSGYARKADQNQAFYQRILSCPVDADVVTIFGSFNDIGAGLDIGTVSDTTTTTLAGCINTTITNLQTIIPLVNLGIVAPTPWDTTQPSTSGNAYNYVEMLKAICERRSIPFLDLWRHSNLRPWNVDFRAVAYSKDGGSGTHPDENGHKLIAPLFKGFLDTLLL